MTLSPVPDEETNPYAAPLAEIGAPPPDVEQFDSADEALRRKHLTHEARVRSIGILGFVVMALWGLYGVGFVIGGIVLAVLVVTTMALRQEQILVCLGVGGAGILCLAVAFASFALARGLRRLRTWARWTWAVFFGLPVVGACVAGVFCPVLWIMGQIEITSADIPPILLVFGFYFLLPGWLLYLLLCRESRVIFTPEYRAVVARTPHIKYKTRTWTKWIALVMLMVVIAALVIAVLLTPWS